MKYNFSSRFDHITPSGIRAVLEKAAGPDMINFSPGFPDNDAFPTEEIKRISAEVLQEEIYPILQYARKPALPALKEALKKFLNRQEYIVKENDDITVTSGSGEGLEMAAKVFLDPGDSIIVEDPTFVGALNGFLSNEAKLIGVPLQDDGMDLKALEKAMQTKPAPKLLYIIPTFQNPTCITTSLKKRQAIYDLCVKYGIIILEDNPYGTLRFKGEDIPTFKAIDNKGIVVYFASLSKIISPGIRLGSITAHKDIIAHFDILKGTSGGAATNWSQYVITRFFETVDIDQHLKHLQNVYGKKSSFMIEMMKKTFHPDVKFTAPDGGMFIWFELPDYADAKLFFEKALAMNIAIVSQDTFAVDKNRKMSGIRLSFTSASMTQIETGISKLGALTYEICAKSAY